LSEDELSKWIGKTTATCVRFCDDVFNPSFFEGVVIWSNVPSNSNKAKALKEGMSIVNINDQRSLHVPEIGTVSLTVSAARDADCGAFKTVQ
jgi:hypothetical protein